MNLNLHAKKVFISGSTQGIGFAIAQELLKEGAEVIINGRKQDKLNHAISDLKKSVTGAIVSGIVADFGNKTEVERLLQQLPQVDILINNVGVFELKEFEEISDSDWNNIIEINLMSGIKLSRQLLPYMLKKKWGRILFISSESGVNIPGNMIHYGMTKSAMLAVANGLSKLTKGTQVTVNTILGGPTYSEGVAATVSHIAQENNLTIQQVKEMIVQETNPHSLLQRFIEPQEIAHLAAYLSSPLSVATNGACLRAEGGVLRTV